MNIKMYDANVSPSLLNNGPTEINTCCMSESVAYFFMSTLQYINKYLVYRCKPWYAHGPRGKILMSEFNSPSGINLGTQTRKKIVLVLSWLSGKCFREFWATFEFRKNTLTVSYTTTRIIFYFHYFIFMTD